jgi:hypothetical protein
MFCWPRIIVYQYNETNVMHCSFNLLRIKGLYMFRALLAHPQEALHKRHLVYCVRIISVGCGTIAVKLQSYTQYTKYRSCSASWGWSSNARNMWRPLILNKLNKKCITLVSLYWLTLLSLIFTEMYALQKGHYSSIANTNQLMRIILRTLWNPQLWSVYGIQRFPLSSICYKLVLRCCEEISPCLYNNVLEPLPAIRFLTPLHQWVIFYLLLLNSYVFPQS